MNGTKLSAAIIILSALSGSGAYAADLITPRMEEVPTPPAEEVFNWQGLYVGGNLGYSFGRWDSVSTTPNFPAANGFGLTFNPHVDGLLGGVQAGYNWQRDRILFGIEADAQITGEKDSANASGVLGSIRVLDGLLTTSRSTSNSWEFPWFATVRGRLGFVADDDWLIYGTGGLAVGQAKFSNATTTTVSYTGPHNIAPQTQSSSFSDSTTRLGYAIGGGVEKAFDAHWTVKAEYLYVDLGSAKFTNAGETTKVDLNDHIVRIGLNYKF